MNRDPFYILNENYRKVYELFGEYYLKRSFKDILEPEEVFDANEELSRKVFGNDIHNAIYNSNIKYLKEYYDYAFKKNKNDVGSVINFNDYGLIIIRPETLGILDQYEEFIKRIGLEVVYEKELYLSFDEYYVIYHDGIKSGLEYGNKLFDLATRTFNYVNNRSYLLIVKSRNKMDIPVSRYFVSFKGKHGDYTPNTFRGDIAFNALNEYTEDGYTLKTIANIPLDPIGAIRALVRDSFCFKGWHDDNVLSPILFYTCQAVHIPNEVEIIRDMSVLCKETDIKILTKKKEL